MAIKKVPAKPVKKQKAMKAALKAAVKDRHKINCDDRDCPTCNKINTVALALVQEIRTRTEPDYGMFVLLHSASIFLSIVGAANGANNQRCRQGFVDMVCETSLGMPYPPDVAPGDFPKPGPKQAPWDGRLAVDAVNTFLGPQGYSVDMLQAAHVCVRAARILGAFVENSEAAFLVAFGESLIQIVEVQDITDKVFDKRANLNPELN